MLKCKIGIVLLLILSLSTYQSIAQDKIIDQIIATVGSNIILKSDIESTILQNQGMGVTSDGDPKCEILENMLIDKLLVAEAELDTLITVNDNQINSEISRRMQYYMQNLGSEKEVEAYFKKSIPELRADLNDIVRNDILSQQMKAKIVDNIKVTPSEVRYYYKNLPEDKKPLIGNQYEYQQITSVPQFDEAEDNRVKNQLREFKKKIENGENFATFAVLYSEDPGSARNGGVLDFSGRGELDPAFATAAFNLKEGQVSNVVKSEFGYHIIQLIERKNDKVKCRHILMRPKVTIEVKEKAYNLLDSISKEIKLGALTFENAAMRYSMDKNSRNNGGTVVNPRDMSSKFELKELDPSVSKIITALKVGEVSKPFESIDEKQQGVVQIIKVTNMIESHRANLKEDYQLLSEMFLGQKKTDAMQAWISKQQSKTYIRIDETYLNCDFKFKNWIK